MKRALCAALLLSACVPLGRVNPRADDAQVATDLGPTDSGVVLDVGEPDLGFDDAGQVPDTGPRPDLGFPDTGVPDTGATDFGVVDTGPQTGQPVFIAAGDNGQISRSTDGITWTRIPAIAGLETELWRGAGFGDGRFVVVGGQGAVGRVLWSTNGTDWEAAARTNLTDWVGGVSWLQSATSFVVVGGNGSRFRSLDSARTFQDPGGYIDGALRAVAAGNGLVVAVGHNTQNVGMTLVSTDGRTWSQPRYGGSALWHVAYANGRFVAVGEQGRCSSSADGVEWTDATCGTAWNTWLAVLNNEFVIYANNGGARYSSPDGINWQTEPTSGSVPNRFFYGNGIYVGFDGNGQPLRSTDGRNWTRVNTAERYAARGIAFGLLP